MEEIDSTVIKIRLYGYLWMKFQWRWQEKMSNGTGAFIPSIIPAASTPLLFFASILKYAVSLLIT